MDKKQAYGQFNNANHLRLTISHYGQTFYINRACFLFFAALISCFTLQGQDCKISGTVYDQTGNPLTGATVNLEGTNTGVITGNDGSYILENLALGNYKVRVRFIGFEELIRVVRVTSTKNYIEDFYLKEDVLIGEMVVVSASRIPEKLTEAPATISVLSHKEINETASLSFGEQLGKLKGVDIYRSGVANLNINSRGFMAAVNFRTRILVDGRMSMLPSAETGAFWTLPVSSTDIDRIEIISGPGTALYGPNAVNGLINIITRHPKASPEKTISIGMGNQNTMVSRIRIAENLGDRFSFKLNFEGIKANDFIKNDTAGVNTDNLGNITNVVFEDMDQDVHMLRLDGSLYYSLSDNSEIIFSTGHNQAKSIQVVNSGRLQFDDLKYSVYQLRLISPHIFMQGYYTTNDWGDSYLQPTRVARQLAGESRNEAIKNAGVIDKSKMYQFEIQANKEWSDTKIIGGLNFQHILPISKGTYLTDTSGVDLNLNQLGVYVQAERALGKSLKMVLAGRTDFHSNYDMRFSPRIGIVYHLDSLNSLRLTYNKAFQAPSISQQELLSPAGMTSGIPIMVRGNGSGFTLADGTKISPLQVEENQTIEFGYKGHPFQKLFMDINGYLSFNKNFISPLQTIGDLAGGNPVTMAGDGVISSPEVTLAYRNFGRIMLWGYDIGLKYQLSNRIDFWFNFSHIDHDDVISHAENDLNNDGVVSKTEAEALSFNTAKNRFGIGVNYRDLFIKGLNTTLSLRHVDSYDFISGPNRATAAGKGTGPYMFKDHGPLGGFESVDINVSYQIQRNLLFKLSVTNALNSEIREMVSSPSIGRLVLGEIRYTFK